MQVSIHPPARGGSRMRCLLLTHAHGAKNGKEIVAARFTRLIEPFGSVSEKDHWIPNGFDDCEEVQLDKNMTKSLLMKETRAKLKCWWLRSFDEKTKTPNWDIASTCEINGKNGILLVEAKAHHNELAKRDRCGAREPNRTQIQNAITDANLCLNRILQGWQLSHNSYYQISNRFAWSWKLTTLSVPVILVYLGFLKANEMSDPFIKDKDWDKVLLEHTNGFVPKEIWNKRWEVNGQSFIPLIRSIELPL